VFGCNFAKYSSILIFFFTRRLSNKPYLIVCFADVNVSQGSVATYARCGETFSIHLTANLPRNLSVKIFVIG